jgi:SpoVK/Ycf46/Vps4 family AAA+-type ATPase
MSIGTTVVAALSKIGTVENIKHVLETNTGYFVPREYPIADGPTNARCSLNFIKRISAEPSVRIVMRSDCVSTGIDLNELLKTISNCNSHNVYGSVNLRWRKIADEVEFTVEVMHSLSLRGLTEESITEVVQDLLRLWQTSMVEVKRCIARIERQEEYNNRIKARQISTERRQRVGATRQNELEVVLEEIKGLVGLQSVKSFAHSLVAQKHLAELRRSHNLTSDAVAPHLVFLGDPGTGKTTVARLVGRLYKGLGLLPKGHVVEVERSSLVGGYLGQTALKTQQMCEKALGGILFIDEAYTLSVNGRDYGDEALATILTFMENNRGKLAVVVAGYPKQMEGMLDSNPGLRSRFDTTITFDNYAPYELMQMFMAQLRQQEYEITESAKADVAYMFARGVHSESDFNARSVRGLVSQVLSQHASVLMTLASPTEKQIRTVSSLSIPTEWVGGRPLLSTELEELEG